MVTILNLDNERKLFRNTIIREDYKNIKFITISEKKRCLKQLLKDLPQDEIIIRDKDLDKKVIAGKIVEYKLISEELIYTILKKVCREIALRFHMEYPLNEVVVIGPSEVSASVISILADEARLFTVVSDENDAEVFDRIYFESGCIIRRQENPASFEQSEKLIIYADSGYTFTNSNMPILNITENESEGMNVINIKNIGVFDEGLSDIVRLWKGVPGVALYSILGIFPSENFSVNTDVKANRIFLLDRSKF